jgi:hypothetical protein
LIGDRDNFGWHLPDLMKRAATYQVYKRRMSIRGQGVVSFSQPDFG